MKRRRSVVEAVPGQLRLQLDIIRAIEAQKIPLKSLQIDQVARFHSDSLENVGSGSRIAPSAGCSPAVLLPDGFPQSRHILGRYHRLRSDHTTLPILVIDGGGQRLQSGQRLFTPLVVCRQFSSSSVRIISDFVN